MTVQQALQHAVQLQQGGRISEAEAIYRQVLAQVPNHPDALHLLGLAAHQTGRQDEALQLIQKAIELNPNAPPYYSNLGEVHSAAGRWDEAIAAYQQALKLRPNFPNALNNLGNAYQFTGRLDEAIESFQQAIRLKPDLAEAHANMGNSLHKKGQFDRAIASFRQALALKPGYSQAWNNLGNTLQDTGQIDEALQAFRKAVSLSPNIAEIHNNLAAALLEKGEPQQAIQSFQQTIKLSPDHAVAHHNLGMTVLLMGDFKQGWIEHEWRVRAKDLQPYIQQFPQPRWTGGDITGQTILLHAEQGFGDAIQFARYAPLVAASGATVLLQCQPELAQLFRSLQGVHQVIARGESLHDFDCHCSLLSLPLIFDTTLGTIPADIPYLHADPSKWASRLASDRLKVGLAWAGRPTHGNDRNRSIPFETFRPLIERFSDQIQFISLQKDSSIGADGMLNFNDELANFADTAALIQNLDLIITVDTSISHLAGALGKPAWVLLPFVADWRWMLERADSPWYPNMRLFRQTHPGDWKTLIGNLDLQQWMDQTGSPR